MRSGDNREFPDYEWNTDLLEKFETRIGTDLGAIDPPGRSEYPQKIEGILVKKFLHLSKLKPRKGIVTGLSSSSDEPRYPGIQESKKLLVSYPTFAPFPTTQPVTPAQDFSRVPHPFATMAAVPVPAPPPKPERPVVPIEPLSALIPVAKAPSPKKIIDDHQKRPRDVVSPAPPSPNEPVVIRPKVEPEQPPQPVIVPRIPIPALPEIQSSFDLLANELESLNIYSHFPSLPGQTGPESVEMHAPPTSVHAKLIEADLQDSAEHMRELEIGDKRTKFVALKILLAWRQMVHESRKWKRLLASNIPVRL